MKFVKSKPLGFFFLHQKFYTNQQNEKYNYNFYNNTIGSKINRRKGFEIKLTTSFGQKKVKPNKLK